jgi:hypothetical protein
MAKICVEQASTMIRLRAEDQRLTEDEATRVGQAPGTPLQELSADALRVLATLYFDREINWMYDGKYFEIAWGPSEVDFNRARLDTVAVVMGEAAFGKLQAEKRAEWVQICAEADAAVRALASCVTCGRSRSLADEVSGSPLCWDCGNEECKREHPSCWTDGHADPPDDELPCDDDDDRILNAESE